MVIEVTKNGVNLEEKMIELEDALAAWSDDPSDENEKKLVALYEQTSGFKNGCGACIAGRNVFIKALKDFKEGDNLEGFAKLRTSFASVKFKWGRLMNKFGQ